MGYSKSNHWMNVIIIDRKKINKTPLYFHKKLLNKKIETRLVWRLTIFKRCINLTKNTE